MNVFITRNIQETDFFKTTLEKVGFSVSGQSLIRFSTMPFVEVPNGDWLFFYSKNGVKYFFDQLSESIIDKKIGTIGENTAKYLKKHYQIQADFVGTGEPLQTAKAFAQIAVNQIVIFPRAKHSKKSIQNQLGNLINTIDLIVYENEPILKMQPVEADILVFTSPMNAATYFKFQDLKPHQHVISIGQTTAATLSEIGISKIIISETPSPQDLAKAVIVNCNIASS